MLVNLWFQITNFIMYFLVWKDMIKINTTIKFWLHQNWIDRILNPRFSMFLCIIWISGRSIKEAISIVIWKCKAAEIMFYSSTFYCNDLSIIIKISFIIFSLRKWIQDKFRQEVTTEGWSSSAHSIRDV